ncbi:MAG: YraN family protein [Alistipes sp.]|nr:YraN family protein [Alistipes sp.]
MGRQATSEETLSHRVGVQGEEVATRYLVEHGFEILHRNWRSGRYELDIVARRDETLHIVEVKCRRAGSLTRPEEAMTEAKFRAIFRAAEHYLAYYQLDLETQFDLIAVEYTSDSRCCIRYIPDAVTPHW